MIESMSIIYTTKIDMISIDGYGGNDIYEICCTSTRTDDLHTATKHAGRHSLVARCGANAYEWEDNAEPSLYIITDTVADASLVWLIGVVRRLVDHRAT